jgi:DNA-binding MarR family transcriptional regulator
LCAKAPKAQDMPFDPIVTNPGRLNILTALCQADGQEFVRLRAATRLTDGNLTTHARKLASAGLVAIEKGHKAGRCVTTITLTHVGRAALVRHLQELTSRVTPDAAPIPPAAAAMAVASPIADDWID